MRVQPNIGILQVLTPRLVNRSFLAIVDFTKLYFPDYQRFAITKHVDRIAAAWNPAFARPLIVSKRDRHLNTVDGRQTSAAALQTGVTEGLAFIWDDWTYEQEAKAFFVFNDVPKQMNGWKKFDADRKAGNAANETILRTLHNLGLTTPLHNHVLHAGLADVTSSRVIQEVYRKGGQPLLIAFGRALLGWKREGVMPDTAKAIDFGRGLKDFLAKSTNLPETLRILRILSPDQIREVANGQVSEGRIDATQIRLALEVLATAGSRRRAA